MHRKSSNGLPAQIRQAVALRGVRAHDLHRDEEDTK